ncbi:MAG: metal-dependent hydrolase [Verrucomicrobiota bacterium]
MVGGVDGITQAALGAAMGEWMLGKRLGRRAWAWGALCGLLPELEILLFPFLSRAHELVLLDGLGHSLILMPLLSWWLARGLARLWRPEKISRVEAWRFLLVVWTVHLLADCLGARGVALGWPFSLHRVAFGVLPPVDFLFSGPLVVAVGWIAFLADAPVKKSRAKKPAPLPQRSKILRWGLALSGGYLLLAVGLKNLAASGFEADLARRGVRFSRCIHSPTPFNILLWRAVVEDGHQFRVGYRSVFEARDTPVRWTLYAKNPQALEKVADLRETKILNAVTNGWWIARSNVKGAWLGDLRLCETRIWGAKKDAVDSRLAQSWLIDQEKSGDRLREIQPGKSSPGGLRRTLSRIGGERAVWEANPRLAGAVGNLPEFLPVDE